MEEGKQRGKWSGVGKFAAISAGVLLVSLGLCGVSLIRMQDEYLNTIGFISILGMAAGVLGLLVALLAAILQAFTSNDKDKL